MKRLITKIIILSLFFQPLTLLSPIFAEELKMDYSDPNHIHAPSKVNEVNYQYDANGNLTSDGERTIEWNQDNLPVKITKGDTEVKFFYDAQGQRIVKQSGQNKTIYVNQYLTIEQFNNGTIYQKYYFANGKRIAQRTLNHSLGSGSGQAINNNNNLTIQQFSNLYFLHHDYLGSTVLATDSNSQPSSNSLSYFPYGSSVNNLTIQQFSNYLFTGQEKDPESDLYNYNARLYNPKTGVFISADSVGGGNRYAYAKNNPMLFTDPTGHMDWVGDGGGGSGPYLPLIMKNPTRLNLKPEGSGIWYDITTAYGSLIARQFATSYANDLEAAGYTGDADLIRERVAYNAVETFPETLNTLGYELQALGGLYGFNKITSSAWYLSNPVARDAAMFLMAGGAAGLGAGIEKINQGDIVGGVVTLFWGGGTAALGIQGARTGYVGEVFMAVPQRNNKVELHVYNPGLKQYLPGPGMGKDAWNAAFGAMERDLQQIQELYPGRTVGGTTSLKMPPEAYQYSEPVTGVQGQIMTFFQWIGRMFYQMNFRIPYSSVPQSRTYSIPPQ